MQKYAYKAIEFAPEAAKDNYKAEIKSEEDYIDSVRNGKYDKKPAVGLPGCYIATAVYGSYTCPEVVALRKYRDDYLDKHLFGRAFIKCYYFISPKLIKYIAPESRLGKFIRKTLDKKVEKVNSAYERR